VEGDVFQPFGMGGQHQKLQDFFTNQKLSRIEKEQVWLLFNGDGALIWVVGMRLDERFRVEGAKEGLKIAWRRGG
jgi:tRNA(Ile)-lysidine synthase